VHEIFAHADGFTISFKKDGLANMGGGLFLKKGGLFVEKFPDVTDALFNLQILKEGHPTYGGISGRDIMALVAGLETVVREDYLDARVHQVGEFG
jgi:tryptophanase